MPTAKQEYWYDRIHKSPDPSKFSAKTIQKMVKDGGLMFTYVGNSSHNSNAFKEGHERIFGKQDDIGKNLKKE